MHPNQVITWKAQLEGRAVDVFGSGNGTAPTPPVDVKALHAKTGELTLENDLLEGALGNALAGLSFPKGASRFLAGRGSQVSMRDLPIPVLVINLDQSSDRLTFMRLQAERLGLEFERIAAVDALDVHDDLAGYFAHIRTGILPIFDDGAVGGYASHLKALRRFEQTDAPAALILEDDALQSLCMGLGLSRGEGESRCGP